MQYKNDDKFKCNILSVYTVYWLWKLIRVYSPEWVRVVL